MAETVFDLLSDPKARISGVPDAVVFQAKGQIGRFESDRTGLEILERLLLDQAMKEVWRTLMMRNGGDRTFCYPAKIPDEYRVKDDGSGNQKQEAGCAILFLRAFLMAFGGASFHTPAQIEAERVKLNGAATSLRETTALMSRHGIAGQRFLREIAEALDEKSESLIDPDWGAMIAARDTGDLGRRRLEDGLTKCCKETFGCALPSVVDRIASVALGQPQAGRARLQRRAQRAGC